MAECYLPDAPLSCVIVDLDGTIVDRAPEPVSCGDAVGDRLHRLGLARQFLQRGIHPELPGLKAWPRFLLPSLTSSFRRGAANSGLDIVQGADVLVCIHGDRRRAGNRQIEELATHMRNSGRFPDTLQITRLPRLIELPYAVIVRINLNGRLWKGAEATILSATAFLFAASVHIVFKFLARLL